MDNLARLGLGWNRLPADAFANFIGISGDGQPLGRLLAKLGSDAAPQVRAAIGEGIALGKGPRPTAQLVRVAAGMPYLALCGSLALKRIEHIEKRHACNMQTIRKWLKAIEGMRRKRTQLVLHVSH